jgi:ABC-type uncharacterized transport system auxiliary subunit
MKYLYLPLFLVTAACAFSSAHERARYTLDMQAVVPPAVDARARAQTIRVALPETEHGLSTDAIQVETDGTVSNIENAAWIEPLPKMVQSILTDTLERSGRFTVVEEDSSAPVAKQLHTTIERFTLVGPTPTTPQPHVEISLREEIIEHGSNRLLVLRRVNASEPVESMRMHFIIPAFERAMAHCMQELAKVRL